ncbi:MAG: amidohydrolase family protein [Planctomycetota bacterium]|jgi:imidazolonepropionase-like amidohydrolase|nr:amidohydrolase family protein [Planctomycetota bacterium]MDP6763076.1 amidohydrolase family protein [Planctomycetota bacterium]MDP6989027.1 amidohydrolase family protein [Planctomycetota bacterium]
MISKSLLPFLCLLAVAGPAQAADILAIKVGRAETISHGTIEHAVILVEDGRIVMVGEDLPIERGIEVLDRDPEWTVMPGLVNCYSRVGLDSKGGNDSRPMQMASGELYPASEDFAKVLEAGVTTLGLYPPGNGIPGQSVVVRPSGETAGEMILADGAYLKVLARSSASSKKMIRKGFEKADDYTEKEQKAREKWEKAKEKWEKDKKKKDDKEEEEDGDQKKTFDPYVAPEPDDQATAFQALRDGELRALISISDSASYLHFLDAIDDEEFTWDLRVPVTRELNLFHLAGKIGEAGRRVVMEPTMSLHPATMRQRNLPAELATAGAKLVLIPRSDSVESHEAWLRHTGELVALGLPREVALRAMTLEAAEVLGMGETLGSVDEGKAANLVFFDGDPLEPGTNIEAVMLDGRFVTEEVDR